MRDIKCPRFLSQTPFLADGEKYLNKSDISLSKPSQILIYEWKLLRPRKNVSERLSVSDKFKLDSVLNDRN